MAMALAVSPTMMGQMAVGDSRTSKPASRIFLRASATLSRSLATRSGSFMRISMALLAEQATVTGRAFEKRVGRARWTIMSVA